MSNSDSHAHAHTHQEYTLAQLEVHLENWHKDELEDDCVPDDWEEHDHFSKVKNNDHYSDRVDVHPWAAALLPNAEVVFFGIEGCPKADSMLANILKNGWNASVVSVPSVSLWDAPELPLVAERVLKRKIVVIVPDGDWAKNPMVLNHARVLQARLMELGVRMVLVAAPPLDKDDNPLTIIYNGKEEELKGVDDFLGLSSGSVADLECLNVEMPTMVDEWLAARTPNQADGRAPRKDAMKKRSDTVKALALVSGTDGHCELSVTMLSAFMHVPHQRVSERLKELQSMGALRVEGSLDQRNSMWNGVLEWKKKPAVVLHPDLRPTSVAKVPLGEMLPDVFTR